jgi:hypothetical protein
MIGIPSPAQTKYSVRPQYQREWEVTAVAAAVDRYRAAEAELAAAGEAGRGALIQRLAARRGQR